MERILVIQTAFIGDAILATALVESLHSRYPEADISLVVRKGNESLFTGHPYLKSVYAWDKGRRKFLNLLKLGLRLRKERFDLLINLQRFFSSGVLSLLCKAGETRGFDKNPLSTFFSKRYAHVIGEGGEHETARNHSIVSDLCGPTPLRPALYPGVADEQAILPYIDGPFITIAPASVWFTKQWPEDKWADFLKVLDTELKVFFLGSAADAALADRIISRSGHPESENLCGKLGLLASAALMRRARMNFVNDSAPLHLASAVNAPVCAVFCSTVPAFGFGPLSDQSHIIEATPSPACRPCGLHGLAKCPEGHFDCATLIEPSQLMQTIPVP